MGSGSFDASAYRSFTRSTAHKTTDEIYSSKLNKNLDPKGIKVRESRDSADNPRSTPIIVALDVTGSMGMIADVIARQGLGVMFTEILKTKPVTDPHLMFMGVGDINFDKAPLQVSQFEADNRIVEQLTQIYLEHGGGGNSFESYDLPWYFAARHTVHDSMIKRGKRGYLFTIGDEEAPRPATSKQLRDLLGEAPEKDLSLEEILAEAQRKYDVFHIIIKEGNHCRDYFPEVLDSWRKILGQHVIALEDHKKLGETIVATIQTVEGFDRAKIATDHGHVVHEAVKHLPTSRTPRLALSAP